MQLAVLKHFNIFRRSTISGCIFIDEHHMLAVTVTSTAPPPAEALN
jgi:hypothetical protein